MKDFKPNIELEYLYRDAGNYKLFKSVVFSNPEGITLATFEENIRARLIDGEFFDPTRWGLPKPKFDSFINDLDHDFCEYLQVNETHIGPTISGTANSFLGKISSTTDKSL